MKENGWTDLWNDDNWIKNEWRNNPKINIDLAGISMDSAYLICKKDLNKK